MNKSTLAFEKKVLLDVVEQMENVEETGRKQARLKRIIFSVGTFGLVIAFILAINEVAHPVSVAFLAGIAGSTVGFGVLLDFAHKQWPITGEHIDMNSVQRRLDELD